MLGCSDGGKRKSLCSRGFDSHQFHKKINWDCISVVEDRVSSIKAGSTPVQSTKTNNLYLCT